MKVEFVNSRGQKLGTVTVLERTANQLLHGTKDRVDQPQNKAKFQAHGRITAEGQVPFCYECDESGKRAKTCVSEKHCILCKDFSLLKQDVAHVSSSGRGQVFKENLHTLKNQLL